MEKQSKVLVANIEKRGKVLKDLQGTTVNPFLNTTPNYSFYEWCKIIILGSTLLPIRLVVFFALNSLVWIVASIALLGQDKKSINSPLSPTRKRFLSPIPYLARAILFVMGYYWIPVKGKPDKNAPIIVMNHVAFVEALYLMYACFPHLVAKKESINEPFVGKVFASLRPILVDRSSRESRKGTVDVIMERATNKNKLWNRIAIFPEGTCTNGTALIKFQNGAFQPAVPVQPVVVKLPYVNFDPHFVSVSGTKIFFQTMCQFVNFMQIEYLPTHYPSADETNSPTLFANHVRQEMAKALNIGTTNHTHDDVIMQKEASKRNLNINDVNIETSVFRTMLTSNDFSTSDIKLLLNQFAEMDASHSGRISFDDFCAALKLPKSRELKVLFNLMDVDEDGELDFREFITGKALVASSVTDEESLSIAFDTFDHNKDGYVDLNELTTCLQKVFPDMQDQEIQLLFDSIPKEDESRITREEFDNHMKNYPEYMGLLLAYYEEKKNL